MAFSAELPTLRNQSRRCRWESAVMEYARTYIELAGRNN
jgi:hypothetical protein